MEKDTHRTAAWRSPSNIAIIKYWGKHANQLPANPSISLTLSKAFTETSVVISAEGAPPRFLFEGEEKGDFAARVLSYVKSVSPELAGQVRMISSRNSFPHSSGIASSASAMSALALCLAELEGSAPGDSDFFRRVSDLARRGSGSASRSVYGPVVLWGKTSLVPGSSDDFAMPLEDVDSVYATMRDSILIIDDGVKAVSSSAGHALMKGHPFGNARLQQVEGHLTDLLGALRRGDLRTFGSIAETEALTLHALMMTSDPSYMLMQPQTLAVLHAVRAFRERERLPVCFTLDAGPNVHLLYPAEVEDTVRAWIDDQLVQFCKNGRVIHDEVGEGPIRIKS